MYQHPADVADILVYLGKHKLNTTDENTAEFKVVAAFLHPSYHSGEYSNNIGLLKLDGNVKLSRYIQPICLGENLPKLRDGYVVGWRIREPGEARTEVLREAQLQLVNSEQCVDTGATRFKDSSYGIYCAVYVNGTGMLGERIGTGNGMYTSLDGLWKIRGIVTRFNSVGDNYSRLTDVSMYIDWIKKTLDL